MTTKQEQDKNWKDGRYPGKITMHWLRVAFDRIAAGENEFDVMCDYGYLHKSALGKHPPKYK